MNDYCNGNCLQGRQCDCTKGPGMLFTPGFYYALVVSLALWTAFVWAVA